MHVTIFLNQTKINEGSKAAVIPFLGQKSDVRTLPFFLVENRADHLFIWLIILLKLVFVTRKALKCWTYPYLIQALSLAPVISFAGPPVFFLKLEGLPKSYLFTALIYNLVFSLINNGASIYFWTLA